MGPVLRETAKERDSSREKKWSIGKQYATLKGEEETGGRSSEYAGHREGVKKRE